jgi:hypothetical protein
MTEPPHQPPLASVEAGLFGDLFGFYTKVTELLRQSSLDDDKRKIVGKRIRTLLDEVTAEVGPI